MALVDVHTHTRDYPHDIGDMPGCAARIDALPIPDAEKALIRSGNARRIFRLA